MKCLFQAANSQFDREEIVLRVRAEAILSCVCSRGLRNLTGTEPPVDAAVEPSLALQPGQYHVNTMRPRQNGHHFADDTFKRISWMKITISIKISLKFVPKGPIKNIPALV